MDTQTAHRLQAEKQVREQHPSFQPARQVNQSVQAPFRQNMQYQPAEKIRSNRYSGYNQADTD